MSRMPVVFVPHGGGPWPFVDLGFPRDEVETLEERRDELEEELDDLEDEEAVAEGD